MSDITPDVIEHRLERDILMSRFTTFHIGGPAKMFLTVHETSELVAAVRLAVENGIPYFILGGGSNLVVSDDGIDGLVICNRVREGISADIDSAVLTASSGYMLREVLDEAQRHGLAGLETFAGIPGTLGGAVYGNAGAYGKCIGDVIISADILDPFTGEIMHVDPSFFEFSYRNSVLKRRPGIVLSASFRLTRGDASDIKRQMDDIIAQRRAKHPPEEIGCAGSFFKNLEPAPGETRRRAAGEVLEKAGAKEMAVGGAAVYRKHANFIVNYGNATAADVRTLAAMLKRKVFDMFGIELQEEVIYIGR